jgi:uncharacterized protein YxjI
MSLLEANDFIIQKKILSAHAHYDFLDLQGNKLGEAEGNLIQVPPKFQVKDTHDNELMRVQGKTLSLHKEFTLYGPDGEAVATIKKKVMTFGGQEYWVEKDGAEAMRIFGDFVNHEYQMECNGETVAVVHRKWASMRDQMGVSITGNVDHQLVIGAAVVIEQLEVTQQHSSTGGSIGSLKFGSGI